MKTENKEVLDIHNKVTASELEKIIKKHVESATTNSGLSMKLPPILIHGSPGLGKSSIVKSIADELGIGFIDVRLAQIEPCDIKGLPVPDNENHIMQWYVNGTWPRDKDSKGILFLDELKSCDKSIQCASYELVLDRKLGDLYKVPDGWVIIAAGNNITDRAVSTTMSSALANRFMHLELDASVEDWVLWAQQHDINPAVIGFINYRNEYLFHMEHENLERGWPSPRSWERVSHVLNLYSDLGIESPIIRKLVYGLIGNRAGVEFMEFLKVNSQFDNVLDYMLDPNKKIKIPEKADGRYALVSSMTYLLWRGKTEADQERRIDGFFRISMELPADFAAMAMCSAMAGNTKSMSAYCAEALFKHKAYKDWSKKYGQALRKRMTI